MTANQVRCPRCGQLITPVKRSMRARKKLGFLTRRKAWILIGVIGISTAIIGSVIFFLYGLSILSLTALMIIGTIIISMVFLVFQYEYRGTNNKRDQQVCPCCRHHWVEPSTEVSGLSDYYTDADRLRAKFDELLVAPTLCRRLLVIHGVGGVGKSSLLWMFRLQCKEKNVPVALSLGDDAKSSADILSTWAKDLIAQDVELPTFTPTLDKYQSIQKRVEEEQAKSKGQLQEDTSKTAIKAAVKATGGLVSNVPIVGLPLSSMLGSASDPIGDWLYSFLTKPEIELLRDPTSKLTASFTKDLREVSDSEQDTKTTKRIVLLLDTFEQVVTLSRWVCSLAQQLPPSVLFVLAGRTLPKWDRYWPGWTAQAYIQELRPLPDEEIRELVHRYSTTQQLGKLDPAQVEVVIRFARGLPLAVTTTVQLMSIQYKVEDFQVVQPQVLADVVDILTRGTPERLHPILEAAAILRWFNLELLRCVRNDDSLSEDIYDEVLRFPFVVSRKEGHTLHDTIREYLHDKLRLDKPQQYREMHRRAAAYFGEQLMLAQGEDATQLALEVFYHQIMADEKDGIKHFRKSAEELVCYQLPNQLRTLLNDVNNYPLKKPNSQLWRDYYNARLRDLDGLAYDKAAQLYQPIAENQQAEPMLRIYASCDWAHITRLTSLQNMQQILERIRILIPELESLSEPEAKIGSYFFTLADLYKRQGKWSEVLANIKRARDLYERIGDVSGVAVATNQLEYYYLDRGMWKEGFKMQQRGLLQEVPKLLGEFQSSYLKAEFLAGYTIYWLCAGRYHEMEARLEGALSIAKQFGRIRQQIIFSRDLGLVLGLQGKVQEAEKYFLKAEELGTQQNPMDEIFLNGSRGLVTLKWIGTKEAEQYLTTCIGKLNREERKDWFLPGFLNWYGMLYEVKDTFESAEKCYRDCLERRGLELWYWHTSALTGLARIYAARSDSRAFDSVLQEAEELSQQYEYNDLLASLRLMQGHLSWERSIASGKQDLDTTLHFYQHAMIYALRYNRFLLDDLLSGRPQGTPFQPIIPFCLKHNEKGESVLRALHEWWRKGTNDIGISRQKTISPIEEGVALLAGETSARQREPGNGGTQQTVLEQLEHKLSVFAHG